MCSACGCRAALPTPAAREARGGAQMVNQGEPGSAVITRIWVITRGSGTAGCTAAALVAIGSGSCSESGTETTPGEPVSSGVPLDRVTLTRTAQDAMIVPVVREVPPPCSFLHLPACLTGIRCTYEQEFSTWPSLSWTR